MAEATPGGVQETCRLVNIVTIAAVSCGARKTQQLPPGNEQQYPMHGAGGKTVCYYLAFLHNCIMAASQLAMLQIAASGLGSLVSHE